jgi:nucleotide-binding universal stress UspA family protein
MRKVLVPLDGSRPSIRALEYVAARRRNGEKLSLVILYVFPDLNLSLYGLPDVYPNMILSEDEARAWKAETLKNIVSNPKVKTLTKALKAEIKTDTGDAATCIVSFAKKIKCHEIVMGTRGMGSMKGLIMGSVATKVAHLVNVPVTLVK